MATIPYCGLPPSPAELLERFNLDPLLMALLALLAAIHWRAARRTGDGAYALAGWSIAAAALLSPLCALSVALFSARIAQHMILILLAAPLIARALPPASGRHRAPVPWIGTSAFTVALWFWHMPDPYQATFASTLVYWGMHLTLFGSAVSVWRELLHHTTARTPQALAAGALTSMQMTLLGAILACSMHPLYGAHATTTAAFGLSPLEDQQLGGTLMWVPGMLLSVWVALRSLKRLWFALERSRAP